MLLRYLHPAGEFRGQSLRMMSHWHCVTDGRSVAIKSLYSINNSCHAFKKMEAIKSEQKHKGIAISSTQKKGILKGIFYLNWIDDLNSLPKSS